ncbi:MAG: O-antigen ligase family protein, partial [Mesorhizobium sp.]
YYWLGMRAEGGAGNAIPFATVTCLGVMMCMAGALSGIERAKGLLIPAVLAGIIAILYSGTRIIWVAIPVSGIAVLLINRRRLEQASLARLLLIAAVMSLVIAILGFHIVSERADFLFSDWDALAK